MLKLGTRDTDGQASSCNAVFNNKMMMNPHGAVAQCDARWMNQIVSSVDSALFPMLMKRIFMIERMKQIPFSLIPYILTEGPECLSQTRLYILLSKQRVGSLISIFLRSTYSLVIIKLIHFTHLFIHYSWGVCECKLGISFQTRTKKYEKTGQSQYKRSSSRSLFWVFLILFLINFEIQLNFKLVDKWETNSSNKYNNKRTYKWNSVAQTEMGSPYLWRQSTFATQPRSKRW